jgi:hypothetical protein
MKKFTQEEKFRVNVQTRRHVMQNFDKILPIWPAPGSEDTELGVFMELEVSHGKTKVYTRVQA